MTTASLRKALGEEEGLPHRSGQLEQCAPGDDNDYHLRSPARGYEWHGVDGSFVESIIATGIVASAIATSH